MYAIEANSYTKHYSGGKIKALSDFSVRIEKGTVFSLLGPNGAGKTTLMKLMLSIVLPTSGEGFILGKSTSDPTSRSSVGYLSENHKFPGFLNAEQVLWYYGKMSGVSSSDLRKRIPSLLKQVRLQEKAKIRTRKYSKGMLQRLGTAQAMINDPSVIFLDEPTDGIDPVGRIEIRQILLNLKERGKTIFINSHLLSEVERVSDEIAVMKDGRLIKKGKTLDFLESTGEYLIAVEDSKQEKLYNILNNLKIVYRQVRKSVSVKTEDITQLNTVIDRLREENILIKGVEEIKGSLEDYFIKIIR